MSLYYNTVIATQRKVSKAYSVEKRQAVKWLLLGPASCSMQRRWQTVSVRNKVFGYYVNTEMSVPLLFTQLVIAERRKGGWWWWWGIVLPYSSHMCIRRGLQYMERVRETLDGSPSPKRLSLVQKTLRLSNWSSTQRRIILLSHDVYIPPCILRTACIQFCVYSL